MADLSDVETALVGLVVTTVYPDGVMHHSVTGQTIRAYRGWPQTSALNADLATKVVNVSVFALSGSGRNTTRWNPIVHVIDKAPLLNVAVTDSSVTFSGAGEGDQVAGLLVDNQPFVYRSKAGDTPALIAALLAQDIQAVRACWLSGTTINIPGASQLVARVVKDAQTLTEWGRQEHGFRLSIWCPDPKTRDLISSTLSNVFSAISFLTLADGTGGRIRYRDTISFDEGQNAQLYRRDLLYSVEYATTLASMTPRMLFGDLSAGGSNKYG